MDVRQLEAFLAVAEHLHFGRAAEQLFMAQAPLSRTIRALEADLGARVFDRNTRTVALTPVGQALVAPAREALAAVRRVGEVATAAAAGEVGLVRVEFTGLAAHPLVAALARGMRAEHPGVRLELASQPISRPAVQRLLDGKCDLVLGRWDQVPPGASTRILTHDSLVVVVPRTHRLAGARSVTFSQIASESFVSLPYAGGSVTTDRLWRLGYAHGTAINNVQFAPDTQSCIALVSAEVGCHLALGSVGRGTTNPDVTFVPLASHDEGLVPDVHLRAAWRTDSTPSVLAAAALLVRHAQPDGEAIGI